MAKKKEQTPEFLKNAPIENAADFFRYFGIDKLVDPYYTYIVKPNNKKNILYGNFLHETASLSEKILEFRFDAIVRLVWVEPENGSCWIGELKKTDSSEGCYPNDKHILVFQCLPSEWKPCKKLYQNMVFLQNRGELLNILDKVNPYGAKFCRENNNVNVGMYCIFPAFEILIKAGYTFADRFIETESLGCVSKSRSEKAEIDAFNRLCQPGTSPKTIFKTTKAVYETLKKEEDIMIWDGFRKLMKSDRISKESMKMLYDSRINKQELGNVSRILAAKYQGKQVFTWESLVKYLERLNTYEAIEKTEALILLADYLDMCRQLNIKPKTDSDSLKREHDVAARTCRLRRDEIVAAKMPSACEKMSKYNYTEQTFSATAISSYDDLLDEATQQRNCVAAYASRIASGKTMIFKVRETEHPQKALITVELDPKSLDVRQKYLACNKPIRNRAQTEFINRWVSKIKKEKKAKIVA